MSIESVVSVSTFYFHYLSTLLHPRTCVLFSVQNENSFIVVFFLIKGIYSGVNKFKQYRKTE